MAVKFFNIIILIFLAIVITPLIAAYCLLWAVMTVGGCVVKRILRGD